MLYTAALLSVVLGLAHSVLGERYILVRLLRDKNLPKLFGGTAFTAHTLRFAWHITTLAWFGFAALLVQLAVVLPLLARHESSAGRLSPLVYCRLSLHAASMCRGSSCFQSAGFHSLGVFSDEN
jgi:hypothetical protein